MITIQKVTSNVQSVPAAVSRHLLTGRTVFLKSVFSIAWSTFWMYSMMAIFKSSIVWGLFEYTEFFITHQRKKSGGERSGELGRPNVFRNDSVRIHIVQERHRHMRSMCRSAILLKVGLVNFIFFQLRNEGIHNIVTVPLGVESLREKNGSNYAPTRHSNPNTNLLIMQWWLVEHMGIVHTKHARFDCWCTPTNGSMPCLWRMWHPKCPLLHGQNHLQYTTHLALSPGSNSCIAVIL